MGGGVDPTRDADQIGFQLNADASDDAPRTAAVPDPVPPFPVAPPIDPAPLAPPALPLEPAQQPDVMPQLVPHVAQVLQEPPASQDAPQDASQWLDATCPYLRSADGTWRSVVPQRGQRCWGQSPPAALEPATQERLCRTEAHLQCEIYVAAEQRHLDSLARDHVAPERLDGRFGVLVRPSTLVLGDAGPSRIPAPPQITGARRTRVAIGLGLAGVFIVVALLAGIGSGGAAPTPPAIAFASPTQGVPPTPVATAPPVPTQTPSPPPATTPPTPDLPTPAPPTPQPTPRPSGAIRTTYRVHKGDTLAGIAAKFGVTTKQIRAINDFGDPPHLRYGTVINIPYP